MCSFTGCPPVCINAGSWRRFKIVRRIYLCNLLCIMDVLLLAVFVFAVFAFVRVKRCAVHAGQNRPWVHLWTITSGGSLTRYTALRDWTITWDPATAWPAEGWVSSVNHVVNSYGTWDNTAYLHRAFPDSSVRFQNSCLEEALLGPPCSELLVVV